MLLWFSIRGTSWSGVWHLISRAAPAPLILSLAIASFSLFVRAVRWRLLLLTAGPVKTTTVFVAISVGYCGNLFLPARAGELIRTLMIHRAAGLSKAFVLTTAGCERLSDAIALVLISSITLAALPVRPGWFAHAAGPFIVAALIGISAIVFLPKFEPVCRNWIDRFPMQTRMRSALRSFVEHVAGGLRTLHDPKLLVAFGGLTVFVWFADACTVVLLMHALALPGTFAIAFLLMTGLGLGSALPATPGYVGVYQFVAVTVLSPFGFSKTDAIAYILCFQAMQYLIVPLWAAFGALFWRAEFGLAPGALATTLKEGRA